MGYPGPFSKNFEGGFFRLRNFSKTQCQNAACIKVIEKSKEFQNKKILLVGDSEAESISDLFISIYGQRGLNLSRSGCSFILESLRSYHSYECSNFDHQRQLLIKKSEFSQIYIFNRYTPPNSLARSKYIEFIRTFTQVSTNVTIISAPPEINGNFQAFSSLVFHNPIGTPSEFNKENFNQETIEWNEFLSRYINQNKDWNLKYVDSFRIICRSFPCRLKDQKGKWLYLDSTHLSAYGGMLILKEIAKM